MAALAVVGAGPGLGLSIAKTFGQRGFDVALIARSEDRLRALAGALRGLPIDVVCRPADIRDPHQLEAALAEAAEAVGEIDVLEFSPADHQPAAGFEVVPALDVTPNNLQPMLDTYLHSAVVAAQQVLPAMRARGSGTLLFTGGMSSLAPMPSLGNYSIAAAGVRSWVHNLHAQLRGTGVYAAHVVIGAYIGREGAHPDTIADMYWNLHVERAVPELLWRASQDS